MNKIRLILRWLFIPLWTTFIFCVFAYMVYTNELYYFSFQDYWNTFLILWDKIMLLMRLKTRKNINYFVNLHFG